MKGARFTKLDVGFCGMEPMQRMILLLISRNELFVVKTNGGFIPCLIQHTLDKLFARGLITVDNVLTERGRAVIRNRPKKELCHGVE